MSHLGKQMYLLLDQPCKCSPGVPVEDMEELMPYLLADDS